MFCNACGNPIPDDARFCAKCGRPVAVVGPPGGTISARSRLEKHLPALALIWIVYSLLRVFAGGAVLFVGSMFIPHMFMFGWPFSHLFLPGLITTVGVGILVLGVLGVAAGWGLWQRESWARIVALILGVVALVHFPIGTALGIYTLWVLLPNDAAAEYSRTARPV
jgi:zinc-ribbon domain